MMTSNTLQNMDFKDWTFPALGFVGSFGLPTPGHSESLTSSNNAGIKFCPFSPSASPQKEAAWNVKNQKISGTRANYALVHSCPPALMTPTGKKWKDPSLPQWWGLCSVLLAPRCGWTKSQKALILCTSQAICSLSPAVGPSCTAVPACPHPSS